MKKLRNLLVAGIAACVLNGCGALPESKQELAGCYVEPVVQTTPSPNVSPLEKVINEEVEGRSAIKQALTEQGCEAFEFPLEYIPPVPDINNPPSFPSFFDLYALRKWVKADDGSWYQHSFFPDLRVIDGKNNNLYLEFNSSTEGEFDLNAVNQNNVEGYNSIPTTPMYTIPSGLTQEAINQMVKDYLAMPRE